MAELRRRIWGMGVMAAVAGMGCSAVPMLAPAPASATMGAEAGLGQPAGLMQLAAATSPIHDALTRADGYFITQYYHKRFNPTQARGNNANCGPTSLAMALRAFGTAPAHLDGAGSAYELIKSVRKAMTGRVNENDWTYPVQVRDGARKLGLNSKIVFTLAGIKRAMAVPGRMMVVNINPSPAYADKLVTPYNGGHFALLTRIEGNRAYLNDPLASGPIVLTLEQLETALTTPLGTDPHGNYVAPYNGGVLLWK